MATHGLRAALPGMSRMTNTGNAVTWQPIRRFGPLAAIVLGHVALFYVVQASLHREEPVIPPREVVVSFITPQLPAPQPAPRPEPAPPKPKTVPVVKKQAPQPRPTPPAVNPTPSQHAISTPPAEPAPPAPATSAPSAPPVAAAPATPSVPQTITSGIEYIQPPQLDYPPVSRRMGEEGKAVVRVLVNEKGRPEQAEIQKTSGSTRLDEAARQAVLRAVFKPFIENGKAVAAYAIVPIRFQLN